MIDREMILDAFNFRHACKLFDSTKKISDADIKLILESARLSPSSFGLEPWKFLVIQNKDIRSKILENAWGGQDKIDKASHVIVCLSRTAKTLKASSGYVQNYLAVERGLSADVVAAYDKFYTNFQENDFKLDTDDKITAWSTRQSYIPLANMMTVAAMRGIDSCPIEGFTQDKVNQVLHNECEIDLTEFNVSYILALGYRQQEPRAKTRLDIERVVSWY